MRITGSVMVICLAAVALSGPSGFVPEAASDPLTQNSDLTIPVPVLAYYYIWYTPASWNRAKSDTPLLGAYSSSDQQIMRQQIAWAKQAGITGFIVSWKNSSQLTPRLEKLITVAREENFKLAIIYEGLDFTRNPVPVSRVAADLDYFATLWGNDPVFSIFDRPLVIWSGTWKFSTDQIRSVTDGRRKRLLILASERTPSRYEQISPYVDGDAYYWSSVNPNTFQGYSDKLTAMSSSVHANHGIWIAPVAPGFDARLIGGTTVVDRNDGATLRTEFNTASKSSPDAIGLISWNEFSENTHIEPSRDFGKVYLTDLAGLVHVQVPPLAGFDSDLPSQPATNPRRGLSLLIVFAALTLSTMAVVVVRTLRRS